MKMRGWQAFLAAMNCYVQSREGDRTLAACRARVLSTSDAL